MRGRTRWRARLGIGVIAVMACTGLGRIGITETSSTIIPQNPSPVPVSLPDGLLAEAFGDFLDMDLSANQELQNQGVTKEQINDVFISSLALTITEPASGADFTFLESLAFFVEAPGIDRQRIASGGPFPAGQSTVELEVDDVDLAPYATAESMTITTEASGQYPEEATTVEATLSLDVGINVGGVVCGGGG